VAVVAVIVTAVLLVVLGSSTPPSGYDVSYPQCAGPYPANVLFGVVGVNGGVAHDVNPCLGAELRWARDAPGLKRPEQPSLSLYIDTGNPGTQVSQWPKGGAAPAYGACNGLLTNACSYLYGAQQAAYSYRLVEQQDPVAAKTAPWWLDVELALSWAGTYQLNIAALKGYITGLHNAGATGPIGIYSTSAQWKEITGLTARATPTAFGGQLRTWVAGTDTTLTQARQNCTSGGFTGVAPTLAQYQSEGFDADLRCTQSR